MKFLINSITAKGRFHENNEDSYICNDKYIVIADGMGGEASGDIASKIAISSISNILDASLTGVTSEKEIQNLSFFAISSADNEIQKYIALHPDADGMGTTVLVLIYINQNLYISWCGDSRCYYYSSKGKLKALTTDHSYVQQLINNNKITIEESYTHPDNNLITKYVGGGIDTCEPEFIGAKLEDNGIVIVCSDGLSGYCKIEDIEKVLQSSGYDNLPQLLLNLAIRKGSDDDITIVTLTPDKQHNTSGKSIFNWCGKLRKKLLH